jgi:predicted MFS family arabinose efflux permease
MRVTAEPGASRPRRAAPAKRWGAFGYPAFTIMWAANEIASLGTAMFDTGSRWLMTELSADPMAVSLIQVAVTLPIFLFTLPAGALADILEARRLLIVVESVNAAATATLAALVSLGLVTPDALLLTTFALGVGGALSAPAWMAITPLLAPGEALAGAIAANNAAFNISRAVGPALGGVVIARLGIAAPFWLCAASDLFNIAALLWWRTPPKSVQGLPAERFASAIRVGVRHAANNRHLRATLVRSLGFFPFASAYWTLLPLVARSQVTQGPQFYGVLMGALGAGAIAGSFALGPVKARFGPDLGVALGALATAAALALFGVARGPAAAIGACLLAGASWTVVLANLYVSAQVALPDWVRGRGLAILLTAIFGAMTVGSLAWGQIASLAGLSTPHFVAAAGVALAIPLTWRWKLQTAAGLDLAPSMHWRAPVATQRIENDRGPVLVTVEYRLVAENRAAFVRAVDELGHERKRDGAFAWGLFEDPDAPGRFLETFRMDSWLELMHQHERVTNADRIVEDQIRRLLAEKPRLSHLIAARRGRRSAGAAAPEPDDRRR